MDEQEKYLLTTVCRKPGMYVQSVRFEAVCAWLDGYDMARGGAPLCGFRQWLMTEGDEWMNLPWWGLIRRLEFPSADPGAGLSPEESEQLLAALPTLFERFLEDREREGLGLIFHRYHAWVMSRSDEVTQDERARLLERGWPRKT